MANTSAGSGTAAGASADDANVPAGSGNDPPGPGGGSGSRDRGDGGDAGPGDGPAAGRPRPRIAGLLLAAGGGRRLGGRPKALLGHRGRPLVESAARVLSDGGCGPVHVVLGASAAEVRARAELPGCVLLDNPDWAEGMGSSLRAGLASLAGTGATAAVVALVDQPGIGAAAVARVVAAYRSPASLAAASYDGRRGHPVLFGAEHWPGIAAGAAGDRGARDYLAGHRAAVRLVECSDIAAPDDIDTPEDLRLLD